MKQQHNAAIICFDRGEEIGRDTLPNWSKKLEIPYQTIYAGMKLGNTIAGRYRFVKVTPPKEAEDGTIISSLAEANKTARTAGKSYGQMQAEKYLQEHPIIPKGEPKEMEKQREQEEMEPMLEDTVAEDLEDTPTVRGPLTLAEFLLFLDEDELLQLETIDRGGNATFIGIAPRFSPLLRNVGDMEINSIKTDCSDGKTVLHVYLSEEIENP